MRAERVPDIVEGEGLARERAGAGDLDGDVRVGGELQDIWQIGEGLRRRRRLERLLQAEMVDHDRRIGIAGRHRPGLLQAAPAQDVHRQPMPRPGGQHPVDAGIGGVLGHAAVHHDADADRARGGRPVGDRLGDAGVGGIDRLDQPEPAGMPGAHLDRIARVVAVHGERGDQQRAVDADGVHRRHHVVARDLRRAVQHRGPGPAGMIALVGVNLGIDRQHGFDPFAETGLPRNLQGTAGGDRREGAAPCGAAPGREASADQLCQRNCCGLRADSWEIRTLTSAGPRKSIASCKAPFRSFGSSMKKPLPPKASIILS